MYKAHLYAIGIALISQSCMLHTSLNMLENRQADELKQSESVEMPSNTIRSKSVEFHSLNKPKFSSSLSSNEKHSDESTAFSGKNTDIESYKIRENPNESKSVDQLVHKVMNALDNASMSVDDLAGIIGNDLSDGTKNTLKKRLQERKTGLYDALRKYNGFENENLIHFSTVGLDQPKQEKTLVQLQSIYTTYIKCIFVQGYIDQDYWLYDRLHQQIGGYLDCRYDQLAKYLEPKTYSALRLDWFKWFKMVPESQDYLKDHASWLEKHGGEKGAQCAEKLRAMLDENKSGEGPWGKPSTLYYAGPRPKTDADSTDSLDEEGYISSEDDASDSELL